MLILQLILLGFFIWCYWRGGRSSVYIRRWVGGGVFGIGLILLSALAHKLNFWACLGASSYPGALCLPYGVNDTNLTPNNLLMKKVYKRGLYGLAFGGCGYLYMIALGHPAMASIQLTLAVGASVILGTLNPVSADLEEILIALLSVAFVPFMAY